MSIALSAVVSLAEEKAGLDAVLANAPGMGPCVLLAAPGGSTFQVRDTTDGLRVQTLVGDEVRTIATVRTAARAIGAVHDHLAGVPA